MDVVEGGYKLTTFVQLSIGMLLGTLLTLGVFYTFGIPTEWETEITSVASSSEDPVKQSVALGIACFWLGVMLCIVAWLANVVWHYIKDSPTAPYGLSFVEDDDDEDRTLLHCRCTDARLAIVRIIEGFFCGVIATSGILLWTSTPTERRMYMGSGLLVVTIFVGIIFALLMIGQYSKRSVL